jgi:hypothetical protein
MENRRMLADVRFDNFDSTVGLAVNGDASAIDATGGKIIRLAQARLSTGGSIFSSIRINAARFSTFFEFRISKPGGLGNGASFNNLGGDGLAFVVQPVSSSLGGEGGGMGYEGVPRSIAVEFDTFLNQDRSDPSSNHVGINLNGDTNHGAGSSFTQNVTPNFDNGRPWYAWVDYAGSNLEVRLSTTPVRPTTPTIQRPLNVAAVLGQQTAFIGFTAATGDYWGDHDVVRWEYRSSFDPITTTPEAEVRGNNVVIADGDTTASTTDHTDFGSVNVGSPLTRTFTVRNTGQAALTTSGLAVPSGFVIDSSDTLAASIPAGGSDTFKVRLAATTAGTFSGNISFANNDANENPYNFAVRGVVNAATPPFAVLAGGVLTVTGTSGNDFIRASISSNVLTVRMNNLAPLTFSNASAISRIVVNALGGNDNITMGASVNRPTSLNGGDGNDSIYGGSAADVVNGGNGTDFFSTRAAGDVLSLVEEIL